MFSSDKVVNIFGVASSYHVSIFQLIQKRCRFLSVTSIYYLTKHWYVCRVDMISLSFSLGTSLAWICYSSTHEGIHNFHVCREHDFEVHYFFSKLIKFGLHFVNAHLQFWISCGWFMLFYTTCKVLKNNMFYNSVLFILTNVSGYPSYIYCWSKIIILSF